MKASKRVIRFVMVFGICLGLVVPASIQIERNDASADRPDRLTTNDRGPRMECETRMGFLKRTTTCSRPRTDTFAEAQSKGIERRVRGERAERRMHMPTDAPARGIRIRRESEAKLPPVEQPADTITEEEEEEQEDTDLPTDLPEEPEPIEEEEEKEEIEEEETTDEDVTEENTPEETAIEEEETTPEVMPEPVTEEEEDPSNDGIPEEESEEVTEEEETETPKEPTEEPTAPSGVPQEPEEISDEPLEEDMVEIDPELEQTPEEEVDEEPTFEPVAPEEEDMTEEEVIETPAEEEETTDEETGDTDDGNVEPVTTEDSFVPPPPPPPSFSNNDELLWGAYAGWRESDIVEFEDVFNDDFEILATFAHWGNNKDFPFHLGKFAKDKGRTLVIFWEATDYNLSGTSHAQWSYDAVLSGMYDDYIREFANDARLYGGHVILIPFSEMNGNWFTWGYGTNGNTAEKGVAAYRHVHDVFGAASNVEWGWAPNAHSVPNVPDNQHELYYPGDAYVDYVGLDGFNFGSPWMTFDEIFGPGLAKLKQYNKPIYLFSMASAEGPGKAAWIDDAFKQIEANHPEIEGIVWFNENKERDWRIWSDVDSYGEFIEAVID